MERKGEMQYFREGKATVVIVSLSLIVFAFMLLVTPNAITNVSAVGADGVGVYWDSDCTLENKVSEIKWGNLTPGSVESRVVYIRNEVEEQVYLEMSTTDWEPERAYTLKYITLKWDYTPDRRIDRNEVLQIELRLSVSPLVEGISKFSFDILIAGSKNLRGDVNGDGTVGIGDIKILDLVYSGMLTDPELVARGDVNGDGTLGVGDILMLQLLYCNVL